MRKEEITSLIIYFLMIAAAVIVGLTAVSSTMKSSNIAMNEYLFMLIVLAVAFIGNVVGLELLHMLGAKIGGYSITSVNLLWLCFEKKSGKWIFHIKDYNGLTGETKIAPNKEKLNLKPYVWCPFFGYAVELAGCIVIYSMTVGSSNLDIRWLAPAAVVTLLISSMLALYNFVPLKLDSMTDGYRMVLLTNSTNVEAYNEYLRIENLQREGKDVGDIKVFETITDFTIDLNMLAVYKHLEKSEYENAEKVLNLILATPKKLSQITYYRTLAQKLYLDILTKDIEEVKKIYDEVYTDEIRRFIGNDNSMECMRAYVLIAGLIEESEAEVAYVKSRIEKAKKNSLPSRIKVEEQLYNNALKIVYTKHPEWEKENDA